MLTKSLHTCVPLYTNDGFYVASLTTGIESSDTILHRRYKKWCLNNVSDTWAYTIPYMIHYRSLTSYYAFVDEQDLLIFRLAFDNLRLSTGWPSKTTFNITVFDYK